MTRWDRGHAFDSRLAILVDLESQARIALGVTEDNVRDSSLHPDGDALLPVMAEGDIGLPLDEAHAHRLVALLAVEAQPADTDGVEHDEPSDLVPVRVHELEAHGLHIALEPLGVRQWRADAHAGLAVFV